MTEKESPETDPSREEVAAASEALRNAVLFPGIYGLEVKEDTESADGKHSSRTAERTDENGTLRVKRQTDWDESRLVPAEVETLYGLAHVGQGRDTIATASFSLSDQKLLTAEYIDYQDATKSRTDHDRAALESCLDAFNLVADSMKGPTK